MSSGRDAPRGRLTQPKGCNYFVDRDGAKWLWRQKEQRYVPWTKELARGY